MVRWLPDDLKYAKQLASERLALAPIRNLVLAALNGGAPLELLERAKAVEIAPVRGYWVGRLFWGKRHEWEPKTAAD